MTSDIHANILHNLEIIRLECGVCRPDERLETSCNYIDHTVKCIRYGMGAGTKMNAKTELHLVRIAAWAIFALTSTKGEF
jgi:hypothetical protein